MSEFTKLFTSKPVLLAPMFEVTNLPFRMFSKQQGANGAITEFISVNQLLYVYKNKLEPPNALKYQLQTDKQEKPIGLQLFGFDPGHFKELEKCFDVEKAGFHFLDFNIGCPVAKICNIGAGSKLLVEENLPKLEKILTSIKKTFPEIPFSIKIRAGYKRIMDLEKFAEMINTVDLLHVTIHPKLAVNPHKDLPNNPNHTISKEFVELVTHPVIINGGITSLQMADELLDYTGAAGAMIGRQAQKYPWVFNSKYQESIPTIEYIEGLKHFLELTNEFGYAKLYMVRDQILGMVRGFSGAKQKRQELQHKISSLDDLIAFIDDLNTFFKTAEVSSIKNVTSKQVIASSELIS